MCEINVDKVVISWVRAGHEPAPVYDPLEDDDILTSVTDELEGFIGKQDRSDDVTMVIMKVEQ